MHGGHVGLTVSNTSFAQKEKTLPASVISAIDPDILLMLNKT